MYNDKIVHIKHTEKNTRYNQNREEIQIINMCVCVYVYVL